MIPTLRDAAQQALEALESAIPWIVTDRNTFAEVVRARHFQRKDTETDESILSGYDAVIDDAEKAITALRAALAEQPAEQEPVAWWHRKSNTFTSGNLVSNFAEWAPLYTAPQPAKPAEQEPVAWCDQYESHIDGLRHYSDGGAREIPLYTAPHLVRAHALEEAAGVCENTLAQHYMKQVIPTHDEALLLAACADCAAAIRQLKDKT